MPDIMSVGLQDILHRRQSELRKQQIKGNKKVFYEMLQIYCDEKLEKISKNTRQIFPYIVKYSK